MCATRSGQSDQPSASQNATLVRSVNTKTRRCCVWRLLYYFLYFQTTVVPLTVFLPHCCALSLAGVCLLKECKCVLWELINNDVTLRALMIALKMIRMKHPPNMQTFKLNSEGQGTIPTTHSPSTIRSPNTLEFLTYTQSVINNIVSVMWRGMLVWEGL